VMCAELGIGVGSGNLYLAKGVTYVFGTKRLIRASRVVLL
jgi:hypothetical protein